jgi:DNA-binding transcriptional regulator YhcF (GntR family)
MARVKLQSEGKDQGLSYKFQRLREKLRQAVVSGELSGKLPGERELARRFRCNAKTLSKALTDLAGEGLLHRSIGRGTFVQGAQKEGSAGHGPWLVLVDGQSDNTLISNLKALNAEVAVCQDVSTLRPSFISQFTAVIDLAEKTPELFVRDLLIRGIPLVTLGSSQRTYSTHSVLFDSALGASQLTRDLMLSGHRRFVAVESRTHTTLADAIRHTAPRYASDFSVDACGPGDVNCAVEYGATACICDSVQSALQTLRNLELAGISVPGRMSVAAVGWTDGAYPCTGYFVDPAQKAAYVADLLKLAHTTRPTTLWLTGTLVNIGTTGPIAEHAPANIPQLLGHAGISI